MHKLITDCHPGLASLFSCYVTTICNVSPYFRSLSIVASVKIVSLVELFSSPKYLVGRQRDSARGYLGLLVEIINNMVQYQWAFNEQLVYSVLRKKVVFEKLIYLTAEEATEMWVKRGGGKKKGGGGGESVGEEGKVRKKSERRDNAVRTKKAMGRWFSGSNAFQAANAPFAGGGSARACLLRARFARMRL